MAIGILVPASPFKLVTNVCCVYLQQEAQVSSRFNSIYLQIAQTLTSKKFTVTLQTLKVLRLQRLKVLPVSDQCDTLAKAKGSPTVSYPLNALAKAEGSTSVIPV
jgi:hypothetical protein